MFTSISEDLANGLLKKKLTAHIMGPVYHFISLILASCPSSIAPLPQLPVPVATPPPVETCSTPTPTTVTGYLPFTFTNNSGISASNIYISVLVNSSTQYLTFSSSSGHKVGAITNFTPSTYLSATNYTYQLSQFENISGSNYTFYIPNDGNTAVSGSNVMKSSRILVSFYNPLTYFIDHNGLLQVPAEFTTTSDNYYTLNDKIEFDLGSNGHNRLNLNLTWVDFFGIPFNVQANYQFLYGSSYTNACGVTGLPTTVSMYNVFNGYSTALNTLQSPFSTYWGGLVATYTNPNSSTSKLRIFAPATAMSSTQSQSNPTPVTFPTNYFLASAISPSTCSWFNAVWSGTTASGTKAYYQGNTPTHYLILDATTDAGAATAKGYETPDQNFTFFISGGPDNGRTLVFPKPTSTKAFFTGAASDYQPAIVTSVSAATVAQVLKVFATSIISGIIPLDCRTNPPVTINNTYAQAHSSQYFENNAILTNALSGCTCLSNIPWYDFYSRTLLTIGSDNLFYTSAYSDFLGTDGTIVITDLQGNNAAATITVTINDCTTSITAPSPYSDTTSYSATVALPSTATATYSTAGTSGPWSSISNPLTVTGDAFWLRITYNSGVYNGQSFVTQIVPAQQFFHPILPGQGTITTSGTNCTVAIGASP